MCLWASVRVFVSGITLLMCTLAAPVSVCLFWKSVVRARQLSDVCEAARWSEWNVNVYCSKINIYTLCIHYACFHFSNSLHIGCEVNVSTCGYVTLPLKKPLVINNFFVCTCKVYLYVRCKCLYVQVDVCYSLQPSNTLINRVVL